ncbi:cell wall hydrolase [Desulfallas thermosapovorans]|uniref:N-acetylmuramoyl-L-alanine amidase n=1 Tax=Desulfallas thermosapovorans DSM 6562 TaxID=1121431 RepID=A0A5S5A031_9FIRM|nr:cell wall hydrolase [Desulfallas thermosapovorans]TYO97747.1 N-acetylmuramoyl-L-alanine amidase [Desulfallas thermosapovorans DSM 6562]
MNTNFSKLTGIILFALCLSLFNVHGAMAGAEKEVAQRSNGITVKYTVQPGDTLSKIAKSFGIDVSQLMRANNLETSVIRPYQELTIPPANKADSNNISRGDIDREDLLLLARAIYAEARGESFEGQVAVGAVILNRTRSPHFPNSIREVIYQRNRNLYQFTPVSDGTINLSPDEKAIKAATRALEGEDPTNGALFFYNPRIASDQWIKTLPVLTKIGSHVFATKT